MYEELKQVAARQGMLGSSQALVPMAFASGAVGAVFGTPSDIANIRMQNDRALPAARRRNYANVVDAWVQMARREGGASLVQGLRLNCLRCGTMTASQLASYDIFKSLISGLSGQSGESPVACWGASVLASLTATTLCSPLDVVRTRIMSTSGAQGAWEAVGHLYRADGFRWLFRGWTPSFIRLGPQTVATLIILEEHRRIYRAYK